MQPLSPAKATPAGPAGRPANLFPAPTMVDRVLNLVVGDTNNSPQLMEDNARLRQRLAEIEKENAQLRALLERGAPLRSPLQVTPAEVRGDPRRGPGWDA